MGFSTGEERPYRSDIDGLRAVAVLSVILYHLSARWLPGGFVGVDIFFVISSFVVSASLLHAPRDRFLQFVAFFYARRLARIVPRWYWYWSPRQRSPRSSSHALG